MNMLRDAYPNHKYLKNKNTDHIISVILNYINSTNRKSNYSDAVQMFPLFLFSMRRVIITISPTQHPLQGQAFG